MLEYYPDVLTVHEVQKILDISRNTAYAMIHKEIIPAFRLGPKSWRVKKSDLIDYLEEQYFEG